TVTKTGFGDGTIATSAGTLAWVGNVGTALYQPGTEVIITANPDSSSRLAGLTGCTLPLCIVEMTAKKNITAKFNKCSKASKDFDGDGKSDVLWQDANTGAVAIWLMNGTTKKSTALAVSSVPKNWQIRAAEDFNGDGKSDILWQNTDTGDMYVWLMDGATIKDKGLAGNAPSNWQIKATGDFNNDCSSDILWQDSVTGDVAIWLMDGTTIMAQAIVQKAMPKQWQFVGLGDLNGDGSADIVWQDTTTGNIYSWIMDGTRIVYGDFIAKGIPPEWKIKAVADYNADGKDDIYLQNADPNKDVIFLMNGLKPTAAFVTKKSGSSQSRSMTGRASGSGAWTMQTTGDYNGDGMNDMLWQDPNGGVYIDFMDGTTINNGGYVDPNVPSQWSIF
ncbi:MAG: VCBS repeat-containing protein, partial [Nitrospirae bacterium]|nr:VCBS repeat-containing protein [Nitrospirota bacterium]